MINPLKPHLPSSSLTRLLGCLLVALCIITTSAYSIDAPTRENTAYSDLINTPTEQADQIISYGDSALQFGELWLAANDNQAPLIVFVHGGCWLNAYDIKHTHASSTALRASGYHVWSLEYRRTGDEGGGWPGSFEDIVQGSLYGINELPNSERFSEVILMGHSAGGHLALLTASDPRLKGKVEAVIGLAAITSPELYSQGSNSCESATVGFMGGTPSERADEYQAAKVIAQSLPSNTTLLIGSVDPIVAENQASTLSQASENTIETVTVEGAGHFDFIDPYSKAFAQLLTILKANTSSGPND